MKNFDERLVSIVPSRRQLDFQEMEFYCFVHFTVNTFTGNEWGNGNENPAIFNPIKFDANQWVDAIKSAGMKGLILTCKHHDGFCLWPSKYTNHNVSASPYKNGTGDIVREVSDACKKGGIKFGIYLSPWDRNQRCYGSGKEYDDYFVNQLTELLTGYGEIFDVWFDGACGECSNGKRQIYDWERYYDVIRKLQPKACISVCGPDVRWCGNESGDTRESEWSVVPKRTTDTERIAENSQQTDDENFRQRKIRASDKDLGSRKILQNEDELVWYPAEVNTSIRPGWFYHESENEKLRSLDELFNIYVNSVGGNATFLLNVPPTEDGLFHPNDVKRLDELGKYLHKTFNINLLDKAKLTASAEEPGHEIDHVRKDTYDDYFRTPYGCVSCEISVEFPSATDVSFIVLKENIKLSQRIERFTVKDSNGKIIYRGTVVGHKKIARLAQIIRTDRLIITVEDSRIFPTISFLGIY